MGKLLGILSVAEANARETCGDPTRARRLAQALATALKERGAPANMPTRRPPTPDDLLTILATEVGRVNDPRDLAAGLSRSLATAEKGRDSSAHTRAVNTSGATQRTRPTPREEDESANPAQLEEAERSVARLIRKRLVAEGADETSAKAIGRAAARELLRKLDLSVEQCRKVADTARESASAVRRRGERR